MKYLKTYKLFEDIDINLDTLNDIYGLTREGKRKIKERFNREFVNTLRDFCLELDDSGHSVKIYLAQYAKKSDDRLKPCCCVEIGAKEYSDYIDWSKLEIAIQEIQSYVSDFGFNVDIEIINDNDFESVDDFITSGIEEYSAIGILIY